MDGLYGTFVGLGCDRKLLAPAGTGALEQERHHWLLRGRDVLSGYCQHGADGMDGLDEAFLGRGWDRQTLAPAGTGAPPWAPEQECHRWILRGGALCKVVDDTNCVGAARTQIICVREAKEYK